MWTQKVLNFLLNCNGEVYYNIFRLKKMQLMQFIILLKIQIEVKKYYKNGQIV